MLKRSLREVGTLAITISCIAAVAVLAITWHLPRHDALMSIPDVLSMEAEMNMRNPAVRKSMKVATPISFQRIRNFHTMLSNDEPLDPFLFSDNSSSTESGEPLPPNDDDDFVFRLNFSSSPKDQEAVPPSDIEAESPVQAQSSGPVSNQEEFESPEDNWSPEEVEVHAKSAEEKYISLHPVYTRCYKKVDLESFAKEVRRTCGDIRELDSAASPCYSAMSAAAARFGCCWETVMQGLESFAPEPYQAWRMWQGLLSGKFNIAFADEPCGEAVGEEPYRRLGGEVSKLAQSAQAQQNQIYGLVYALYRNLLNPSSMFRQQKPAAGGEHAKTTLTQGPEAGACGGESETECEDEDEAAAAGLGGAANPEGTAFFGDDAAAPAPVDAAAGADSSSAATGDDADAADSGEVEAAAADEGAGEDDEAYDGKYGGEFARRYKGPAGTDGSGVGAAGVKVDGWPANLHRGAAIIQFDPSVGRLEGERPVKAPKATQVAHVYAQGGAAGAEAWPAGWGRWTEGGPAEDALEAAGLPEAGAALRGTAMQRAGLPLPWLDPTEAEPVQGTAVTAAADAGSAEEAAEGRLSSGASLEDAGVNTWDMPWDTVENKAPQRAAYFVDGLADARVPTAAVPKYRESGLAPQEHPLHFLLDDAPEEEPAAKEQAEEPAAEPEDPVAFPAEGKSPPAGLDDAAPACDDADDDDDAAPTACGGGAAAAVAPAADGVLGAAAAAAGGELEAAAPSRGGGVDTGVVYPPN